MMPLIKFQGNEYILAGSLESGGPIATRHQYQNGQCSYAHLKSNGDIMRFNKVIGHRDEIEIIGACDVVIECSLLELLTNSSWTDEINYIGPRGNHG